MEHREGITARVVSPKAEDLDFPQLGGVSCIYGQLQKPAVAGTGNCEQKSLPPNAGAGNYEQCDQPMDARFSTCRPTSMHTDANTNNMQQSSDAMVGSTTKSERSGGPFISES